MLDLIVPVEFLNQTLRFTAPEQCGILKGLQLFIISNQLL